MLRPTWFLLVAALAASPAAAAPGDDDGRGGGFDHDHALRAAALGLAGAELTAELTFAVRTTGPEVIALDLGLGLPLPADATVTAVTLADGVTRRAGTRTAASTAAAVHVACPAGWAPRASVKAVIAHAFGVSQPRSWSHGGMRNRGTMLPPTADATSTAMFEAVTA